MFLNAIGTFVQVKASSGIPEDLEDHQVSEPTVAAGVVDMASETHISFIAGEGDGIWFAFAHGSHLTIVLGGSALGGPRGFSH